MRVKINDKIYNSESQPIMIILSEGEKKQIEKMYPDATKYCVYPSTKYWEENNYQRIKKWMEE